ncbi:hypothetical protein AA101099_2237 [Neoasaia chiangmaiensis NBRC 101099]|uniref:Uncharacterized protein n=1 Tax=Neoasaia chiangmaiensis TaxID=320497 RepID=A0A1U9KSK4_9PROT|nr:DUF3147 family protein [Neoasaia chiangmaiensis]AQS88813.1 hypothetical protein A0U93_13745 [Neoasaia chiangmaiensis]GBR40711.1 hypothetical protein AA101099_2237 [Neoasaia chiangmaiensis NBRC 101099]GEN13776.1 hypothetical protein NCH01_02070 [Neoasaia chiangmaiensis]
MPFFLKATIAGLLVALVSSVARRYPGFGALIASLPLISVLGMIFLWFARPDATNMATHMQATFWYVLPSLPMFLVMPVMLHHGIGFWWTLISGCGLTIALYALMTPFMPN